MAEAKTANDKNLSLPPFPLILPASFSAPGVACFERRFILSFVNMELDGADV
jgi:hypothetical protein